MGHEDRGPEEDRSGAAPVQSVDRALQVLELIARMGSAGVTELAAELGVHKSTVSHIIASLGGRDFVEQLTERGKYRLGFAVVRLAGPTAAQIDLAKQGQDICDGNWKWGWSPLPRQSATTRAK